MTGAIPAEIDGFLRQHATDDVRAAVRWLLEHGYPFAGHRSGSLGLSTLGSAFVFAGAAEMMVMVDRDQWCMDVVPTPGGPTYQFDLLVPAQRGRPYWECFPTSRARDWSLPLPAQLPPGVSWHETLPQVLAWLSATAPGDVASAVKLAQDQRFAMMWPDGHTGKRLRRAWRAQGMPLPPTDAEPP